MVVSDSQPEVVRCRWLLVRWEAKTRRVRYSVLHTARQNSNNELKVYAHPSRCTLHAIAREEQSIPSSKLGMCFNETTFRIGVALEQPFQSAQKRIVSLVLLVHPSTWCGRSFCGHNLISSIDLGLTFVRSAS